MRIARFSAGDSLAFGIIDEQTNELVALKGDPLFSGFETTGVRYALEEVKLHSPMIPRSKVVGLGGTYLSEGQVRASGELPKLAQLPSCPVIHPGAVFIKPNTCVIGPDDPIVLPAWTEAAVFEAELAVVIGKIAKNIPVEQVHKVIFGYTVANDLSACVNMNGEDAGFSYLAQTKSFDSACPIGPFISFLDEVDNLYVKARINGQEKQDANTNQLIASVAEIVSWVSHNFSLLPGDVIITGTPSGAGRLKPGDVIEVEVEGIGTLRNPVVKR